MPSTALPQLALDALIQLEKSQIHAVNWRPQVLILYKIHLSDEQGVSISSFKWHIWPCVWLWVLRSRRPRCGAPFHPSLSPGIQYEHYGNCNRFRPSSYDVDDPSEF